MTIEVSEEELALLLEALDSHLYWQVSEQGQRNSGYVSHDDDDENAEECKAVEALVARLEKYRVTP